MARTIRHSATAQRLFVVAVALVLAVRILIPIGFMPSVGTQGVTVELCSGVAGQKVYIDLGKKRPIQQSHQAMDECSFAAGLGQGLLSDQGLALSAPLMMPFLVTLGKKIADLTLHRLAAPPPPSQAPPTLR